MDYLDQTKDWLLSNEDVRTVWVDEDNGDIYLCEKVGLKKVSRDEILGTKKEKKENGTK